MRMSSLMLTLGMTISIPVHFNRMAIAIKVPNAIPITITIPTSIATTMSPYISKRLKRKKWKL